MIKNLSFTKVILISDSELTQIFNVIPLTLEFFQIQILLERCSKMITLKFKGASTSTEINVTLL